jgi:hypothetical protein
MTLSFCFDLWCGWLNRGLPRLDTTHKVASRRIRTSDPYVRSVTLCLLDRTISLQVSQKEIKQALMSSTNLLFPLRILDFILRCLTSEACDVSLCTANSQYCFYFLCLFLSPPLLQSPAPFLSFISSYTFIFYQHFQI